MSIAPETKPKTKARVRKSGPFFLLIAAFFSIELFAFFLLTPAQGRSLAQLWPLVFGLLWAVGLSCLLRLLPAAGARVGFGILYFLLLIYAAVQTGYYQLFSQMMWLSDFRYASEGSDYFDVLLSYPAAWWLGLLALVALGIAVLWFFPRWEKSWRRKVSALCLAAAAGVGAWFLPQAVFLSDSGIRYAGSDYGRSQSAEAAYENMFNTHRLYQVCGLCQTLAKDICVNEIYPHTPGYAQVREAGIEQVDAYFAQQPAPADNAMTGALAGKNVVLVLMESMDDWMIGEHTPTLCRLMEEGIQFTRFYTPGYGGIRTFNSEFCINTGSFLSSQGGYAFDYVTNSYPQSLASLLTQQGYSALEFHYNSPDFYSRGVFAPALGYEEYVSYEDYLPGVDSKTAQKLLYDDLLLFDNQALKERFFRPGQKLNFLVTRSAHLSYKYNEVLSYWGLQKYPQYYGLTGNEETDCAYLKARLVDDLFARLLEELALAGELENTVIVGITDHYTYGYKNEPALMELSGVSDKLLLEKTPCFIWSADLAPMTVDKPLCTIDLLPTLLNLLGVESPYSYLGRDAFDPDYPGFVPFSDGSWITPQGAYTATGKKLLSLDETTPPASLDKSQQTALTQKVQEFIRINNLILETDYFREEE